MLSRRTGVQHLELVEDTVQYALMTAIEQWSIKGMPDIPTSWLYRVANNKLLDELRQQSSHRRLLEQNAQDVIGALSVEPTHFLSTEISDDLLRMLFICCDDSIPEQSRLVFALKNLCGFNVAEIALRLFTSEANVYKRLGRARAELQKNTSQLNDLTQEEYSSRIPAVRKTLYLMFTEGYLSSHAETAIRLEFCNEAIRLTTLLADHAVGQSPETFALLALMHLHIARMAGRQDGTGGLLLLEEQDRSTWDKNRISEGLRYLAQSAQGDNFTRYHAEAGIAAEHCLAPSFKQTRWDRVVENYLLLEKIAPSPIHTLNRAIALAEWQSPEKALELIRDFDAPIWLSRSFYWSAVLADLYKRCGNSDKASRFIEEALELAPTPAIKTLLRRRLHHTS